MSLFGTTGVTRFMRGAGAEYIEWETLDGGVYAAADLTEICNCDDCEGAGKSGARAPAKKSRLAECNICTCRFNAQDSRRCPSCGSKDIHKANK